MVKIRNPIGDTVWIAGALSEGGSVFHLPIRIETEAGTVISPGPFKCVGLEVRVFGFELIFERKGDLVRLVGMWDPYADL